MQRQRLVALAIIAVVICSSIILIMLTMQEPQQEEPETESPIVPHPFNYLSWWEITWELNEGGIFQSSLAEIVGNGPRLDFSDGFDASAEWIMNELEERSISASQWGPHNSVVGHQKGYGTDNRAIVVGAHLDSTGVGVNQNGAGCSTVLMIAAILSQFRLPIDIYYCFFGGNLEIIDPARGKRALWGGHEVSQMMKDDGIDVVVFLNFDELLFVDPEQPEEERLVVEYGPPTYGYHKTAYLAELLVQFMTLSGINIMTARQDRQTDTDHQAFWSRGFAAINIKSGHTIDPVFPPSDSLNENSFSFTQAMLVGRAAASMIVYLSLKGNGELTRYKRIMELEPHEQAGINTVMSVSQNPVILGSTGKNSSISIRIENNTRTLLFREIESETNFSFECDLSSGLGPLSVTVLNTKNTTSFCEVVLEYTSDTDGNLILDADQYSWPDPDPPLDWDKDGLSDEEEKLIGTDIFVIDTDGDEMSDKDERDYDLDPLRDDSSEDADNDELTNLQEIQLGTHPGKPDTDDDGMPDFWEVSFGLNPLVNDSSLDPDNDTLTNLEEFTYGSHPLSTDGDDDGVPDIDEIEFGMNPLNEDSDGDGLRDKLELQEGLNPVGPDSDIDFAQDGPDHNPRINTLIIIGLVILVPVTVGTIVFKRRIK